VRGFAVESGIHDLVHAAYSKLIELVTPDVQSRDVGGVSVKYRTESYASWERLRTFEGELSVMEQFSEDISDGDVVWDVGANMGTYTCLAGKCADDVTVVSFEPIPGNVERLKTNAELNGINSIVREEALDETDGEMSLSSGQGGDGQYSFTDGEEGIMVPTSRADTLVEQGSVPQPSVVKIDVEGAEVRVLRGMKSVLERTDYVYVEVHPTRIASYGDDDTEVRNLLSKAGLDIECVQERGSQYFLKGTRIG
jgi:FkbM family methyltransferase